VEVPVVVSEIRRFMEAAMGRLTPTKAQELAKSLMEGQGKDQIGRAAHDLMEWSIRNRERITELVRAEVRSQLKQLGLATRDEVDALRKRVRDLEKQSGRTTRAKSAKRSEAKRPAAKRPAATRPTASTPA
jgi:hypothetical protein